MYTLRVHSIRKFFKTQLLALGIQPDYVDYFMGDTIDTYDDVQSLGIEKLREVYANAALSIRPKAKMNRIEVLKERIRALENGQSLTREGFTTPARTERDPEDPEQGLRQLLGRTLRGLVESEGLKA